MKQPLFQVDAFTGSVFSGNPAAVCPLEQWLDDSLMQNIAAENNLSETAFFVQRGEQYDLRWFTPTTEIELCGHATLASGFVVMTILDPSADETVFSSMSGRLTVRRSKDLFVMDFPSQPPVSCDVPEGLEEGLRARPRQVLRSQDYVALFDHEDEVRALAPDFEVLRRLDRRGVIVTAPGKDVDFVSRFFAPGVGINEDPVTGSAHCALTPYWTKRLHKTKLHALQVSQRGGELFCEQQDDRVLISGRCALYMRGDILL